MKIDILGAEAKGVDVSIVWQGVALLKTRNNLLESAYSVVDFIAALRTGFVLKASTRRGKRFGFCVGCLMVIYRN